MPALSYIYNTKRVDAGAESRLSRRQIPRPNSNSEPLLSIESDDESDNESDDEDGGTKPSLTTLPIELTPTTTLLGQTTITIRVSLSTLPQPDATAVTTTSESTTEKTTPTSIDPSPSSTTDVIASESAVATPSPPPQSPVPVPPTNNNDGQSAPPVLSPSGSSTDPFIPLATGDGGVILSGQQQQGPAASGNITNGNKGLATGAIVGIVIAISLFLILAAVFLVRKTLLKRRRSHSTEDAIQWPEEEKFGDRFVAGGGVVVVGGAVGGKGARGTITPYPFTSPSNAIMSSAGPTRAQPPQMNIQRVPPPRLVTTPVVQQQKPPYYVSPVGSDTSPIDLPNPYAVPRPPTQIKQALPQPQTALDTHTVRSTFVPTLPDELNIVAGEKVRVLSVYDDGWALCERTVSPPNGGAPEKGMVPMECLMADEGMLNAVENKRASSLRNVA